MAGLLICGGISGRRRVALAVMMAIFAGAMLVSCGKSDTRAVSFYQLSGLK